MDSLNKLLKLGTFLAEVAFWVGIAYIVFILFGLCCFSGGFWLLVSG